MATVQQLKVQNLRSQMNKNSASWHTATTQAEKDRLHQENIKLQQQIDSMTGSTSTFNPNAGKWTSSGGSGSSGYTPSQSTSKPTQSNTQKYEYNPPRMGGGYVAPGTSQVPKQPSTPSTPTQQIGGLYHSNVGGNWLTYDKYGNVYAVGNTSNKQGLTPSMVNSGELQAIGKVEDYVTDQYRKQLAYLQSKNPNASLGSYFTGVDDNDMAVSYTNAGGTYFPTDYGKVIQQAKEDFAEAQRRGDQAGMDRAHQMAEMARQIHGYTGGADGSQNIPIFVDMDTALPGIGTAQGNEAYLWEMRNYIDSGGLYGSGIKNNLGTNTGAYDSNGAALTILDKKRLNEGVSGTMTINGTTYYRMEQNDMNGNPVFMNPTNGKVFSGITNNSGRMELVQTGQVSPVLNTSPAVQAASVSGQAASLPAQTGASGAQASYQPAVQTGMASGQQYAAPASPYATVYGGNWATGSNGYGTSYGTDSYGQTDYSVLIRDAMNAGADWQTVQELLDKRMEKAQQNGYYQYMNDDLSKLANQYIKDNQYGLYQQYMDQMNQQYDQIAAQQEAAQQAAVQQAINQLSGQKTGIEQSYEDLYRQLYLERRRAEKNLPQQLAAMGITGGMAEGTALGIQTDYTDALRQGEQQKLSTLNEIDQAIADAQLTGDIGIAQQAAQLAMDKLATYGSLIAQMQNQQNYYNDYLFNKEQADIANNFQQQMLDRQELLDQYDREDISRDRKLQIAQYLYENTGDASLLREFGLTDAQIALMGSNWYANAMQAARSSSSGSSSGGSSGSSTGSSGYGGGSGTSSSTQAAQNVLSGGIDPFGMAFGTLGTVLGQLGSGASAASDSGLNQLQAELNRIQDSGNLSSVPTRAAQLIQQYYERGAITEDTARRLLAQYGISV